MGRVIHFEIHAADPERAVAFYHGIFGWHIEQQKGAAEYWLAITGDDTTPGIDGAVVRRIGENPPAGQKMPVTGATIIIQVENIDIALQNIKDRGCQVIEDKKAVPNMGWKAYAQDTEGNVFGVMQSDESAK